MGNVKRELMTGAAAIASGVAMFAGAAQAQTYRFLLDFGPTTITPMMGDPAQDATTASPDTNGNHWNNVNNGNFFRLVDTDNALSATSQVGVGIGFGGFAVPGTTQVGFQASGGYDSGIGQFDGLNNPDAGILGDIAIPNATQDFAFFFETDPMQALGFRFSSMESQLVYDFEFFGSQVFNGTRETTYNVVSRDLVSGNDVTSSVTLQTSGTNIGSDGMSFANDNIIARIEGVSPRANGTIDMYFDNFSGNFAYLNVVAITARAPVTFDTAPQAAIADAGGTLSFSVAASTTAQSGITSYQWQRDGVDLVDDARISGATTDTLTITDANVGDAGVYTCLARVQLGSGTYFATSPEAIGAVRGNPFDLNNDGQLDFFDLTTLLGVL